VRVDPFELRNQMLPGRGRRPLILCHVIDVSRSLNIVNYLPGSIVWSALCWTRGN
jgi:hypothetical protein